MSPVKKKTIIAQRKKMVDRNPLQRSKV